MVYVGLLVHCKYRLRTQPREGSLCLKIVNWLINCPFYLYIFHWYIRRYKT